MRIQDLENRTGLERPTIRFYEREGLIHPKRQENGYREYSDTEVDQLMKIKLLRQLGMSVEKIRALQQGSADFASAMEEQIRVLTDRIEHNIRAREVCRVIRSDGADYQTMDAEHYLKLLESIPEGPPLVRKNFQENLPKEIHPWRRYFARTIDYALFGAVVDFILFVVFRIRPLPDEFLQTLLVIVSAALFIPVEALMLNKWGTTPGKLAMGIRLESIQGGFLSYSEAYHRTVRVWKSGMGFCIPVIELIANQICYCKLTGRAIFRWQRYNEIDPPAEMDWDEETEFIYSSREGKEKAALASVLVVCLLLGGISILDMVKPKYRGDLTIAEFASNYNFYYSVYDSDVVTRSERLQPDGKWYTESDQYVTIYVNGQPEVPEQTFSYETDNGYLTGIHYENSWSDFFYINPVPNQCKIAAITILMSQEGNGLKELYDFGERLDSVDFTKGGSFIYGGMELRWSIEKENCISVDGRNLVSEDENRESSVSTVFDIIINPT